MKPIIRRLTAQDNKAIASVIRLVLEEHGMDKPGTVYTDPTTDNLAELFQEEKSWYWVVTLNDKIVGGCGIYPTKNLPSGCVELVKLYLLKETRGTGIGKQLIEMSFQKAQEYGYSEVYLESMPELNSAVGLYEKLGFKRLEHPLGESGHFACNLWMTKSLPQ